MREFNLSRGCGCAAAALSHIGDKNGIVYSIRGAKGNCVAATVYDKSNTRRT